MLSSIIRSYFGVAKRYELHSHMMARDSGGFVNLKRALIGAIGTSTHSASFPYGEERFC